MQKGDLAGVIAHYERLFDEDARLRRPSGKVERIRTRQLLAELLPAPPARVLDVGGGTGIHAEWLLELGFDVVMVDLTPRHVEMARRRALQAGHHLDAVVGDARDLDQPDDEFDAVLLLGPLYHLTRETDRLTALRQARRVAKPGALIAASAISRFAGVLDLMSRGLLTSSEAARISSDWLASGITQFPGESADVYFHRPDELRREMEAAGLGDVILHGIEGPGWAMITDDADEALVESVLETARLIGDDPAIIAASSHLLGIGHAP